MGLGEWNEPPMNCEHPVRWNDNHTCTLKGVRLPGVHVTKPACTPWMLWRPRPRQLSSSILRTWSWLGKNTLRHSDWPIKKGLYAHPPPLSAFPRPTPHSCALYSWNIPQHFSESITHHKRGFRRLYQFPQVFLGMSGGHCTQTHVCFLRKKNWVRSMSWGGGGPKRVKGAELSCALFNSVLGRRRWKFIKMERRGERWDTAEIRIWRHFSWSAYVAMDV